MSRQTNVFIQTAKIFCKMGLGPGTAGQARWRDGNTRPHGEVVFGLVNRYDLAREFPILTIRRTYLKRRGG